MQFATFGDVDGCTKYILRTDGKRLPSIATVGEHLNHFRQGFLVQGKSRQCTLPVSDISSCYCNRVGPFLGIDGNMTLDARYFFACVIPFVLCTVCIFNALRINDAKRGFLAATMVDAGRANLIFLSLLQQA